MPTLTCRPDSTCLSLLPLRDFPSHLFLRTDGELHGRNLSTLLCSTPTVIEEQLIGSDKDSRTTCVMLDNREVCDAALTPFGSATIGLSCLYVWTDQY